MCDYIKKYKKYKLKYNDLKKKEKILLGGIGNYVFSRKFRTSNIKPRFITILSNGDFAVSGDKSYITIFNSNGTYKKKFSVDTNNSGEEDIISNGLKKLPNGDIVVCVKNSIKIFDSNGNYKSSFDCEDSIDITVHNNGNIYVLNRNNSVQIFNSNGEFINNFGLYGSEDGQFNFPSGIIQLNDENIAIVDCKNNRVQIFNSNGEFIKKFGSYGSEDGEFNSPSGIIQLTNGNIVISDCKNNRIQIFNSNGEFIEKFGSYGDRNGEFKYPLGLTVLSNDDIIICDTINSRIQIFTNNQINQTNDIVYEFLKSFGSLGNNDNQLNSPISIDVFPNGNFVVIDFNNNRIKIFDSEGNFLIKFGKKGNENGEFDSPNYVKVLPDGNIIVCDSSNNRIQIFDSEGNFIRKFGSFGTENGHFDYPYCLTVLNNGNFLISDCFNNRIQLFNSDGEFISIFGELGRLTEPKGILQHSNGNVFICDNGLEDNMIVVLYDSEGNFIKNFGSEENLYCLFNNIIELPNKDIAVVDNSNNNIQIFNENGIFKRQFGSFGTENGQFKNPSDIALSSNGNLLVCDTDNNRILIFFPIEQILNQINNENNENNNNKIIPLEKFDLNLITKFIVKELVLIKPIINDYLNNLRVRINLDKDILEQISKTRNILKNNYMIKFTIKDEEIGIDSGGITRKILSKINTNTKFFVDSEGYKIINKYSNLNDMEFLGYFWSYVIKINEALPIFLHPLMLLFLTTSWNNYISIFDNYDRIEYFLNSFNTQIIKSYMTTYNFEDNNLFIETYQYEEFWDSFLTEYDIKCILKESVKSSQGKIEILLKKMKYDFAIGLKNHLETFKSSLFNYFGKDISNLGINLISRILSGDPDITWEKILPFFKITSNDGLDTETNKNLIMEIIKSEITDHPDYPTKLFEALVGAKIMSSSYDSKLEFKLLSNSSDTLTNYHTCFGWVDINLPMNFNSMSNEDKKNLLIIAIGYDAIDNEIKSKINQLGGSINIIVY